LNSHGKPLAELLIEQGLEPGPELLLEGNKTSKSASASERHGSWRPTHCPRRESAAVPSHPTLLLPSNCNPWSGKSRGDLQDLSTSQRLQLRTVEAKEEEEEEEEEEAHTESQGASNLPNDMVLLWCKRKLEYSVRDSRSLLDKVSMELYRHDGQDSQERGAAGKRHIDRGIRLVRGQRRICTNDVLEKCHPKIPPAPCFLFRRNVTQYQ
jgi:hypothetical protein